MKYTYMKYIYFTHETAIASERPVILLYRDWSAIIVSLSLFPVS